MKSGFESSAQCATLSIEEILQYGSDHALLDSANSARLSNPKELTPSFGDGVIVPALRVIEDFKINETVYFFEPQLHDHLQEATVTDLRTDLDMICCTSNSQNVRSFISPKAFGLWRAQDFEQIMQTKAKYSGKQHYTPIYLISVLQKTIAPETDTAVIKSFCRRFGTRWLHNSL